MSVTIEQILWITFSIILMTVILALMLKILGNLESGQSFFDLQGMLNKSLLEILEIYER